MICTVCSQKELFPGKVNSTYHGKSICPSCLTQHTHKCHLCGRVERDAKIQDFEKRVKDSWISYKDHDLCPQCWSVHLKTCNSCRDMFITEIDGWGKTDLCKECGPFNVVKDAVTGEHIERVSAIWVQDGPFKVPVSHKTAHNPELTRTCPYCGVVHIFKNRTFKNKDSSVFVCNTCFGRVITCELCGEMFLKGDSSKSFYLDLDDKFIKDAFEHTAKESDCVCSSCKSESISRYHANHREELIFYSLKEGCSHELHAAYGAGGDFLRYMGFELEVDAPRSVPGSQVEACAVRVQEHLSPALVSITQDGSLVNGFEIISAPATLEWYEKYWNKTYAPMTAIVRRYGLRSHDPGTCGLHVHVNKRSIKSCGDLMRWFTWFIPEIAIFSRRKDVTYCMPVLWDESYSYSFKDFKELNIPAIGHKVSLNLKNEATAEFRIFRGTINQRTLLATLQFVDGFVQFINDHDLDDLPTTTWEDIVSSINKEAFQQYCKGVDFHKYDSKFTRNYEKFMTFDIVGAVREEYETREAL